MPLRRSRSAENSSAIPAYLSRRRSEFQRIDAQITLLLGRGLSPNAEKPSLLSVATEFLIDLRNAYSNGNPVERLDVLKIPRTNQAHKISSSILQILFKLKTRFVKNADICGMWQLERAQVGSDRTTKVKHGHTRDL